MLNTNLTLRFDTHVSNPLKEMVGLPTSCQLVAQALNQGVNRVKLQAVIDDLELMLEEITQKH